jgi:hypothetical protein
MRPTGENQRWRALEAGAHLPKVQEQIRREIRKGTIRVVPEGNAGIRIVPVWALAPELADSRRHTIVDPYGNSGRGARMEPARFLRDAYEPL